MLEKIKALKGYDEIEKHFKNGDYDLSTALAFLSEIAYRDKKKYYIYRRKKGSKKWILFCSIIGCTEAYEYAERNSETGYQYKVEEVVE